MAVQDLILCIDVGGDSIKASEFRYSPEAITLDKFAFLEYTNDSDETSAFETMIASLKDVITSNHFEAKNVYLSMSGQNALMPFAKVPAMSSDPAKLRDMITYEATQRIPYPLPEVAWDYQIIDNPEGDDSEIDVMLVSVKNKDVIAITEAVESVGKKVKAIEVSPTALYNSARANGIGDSQCEMILNIGGKSSTLIFLDGPRFFMRTIPVAGNTITQQIAKEFNMSFVEADEIKRRHGFVALGGAYEDPESDVAATVSKIVRNVMTRLHGEINRSINVYRATQHGRRPEKLYLSGGSSIMAFTPRFFIEKLRIPVDYFNPFQIIQIGENVNQEALSELAHLYGETIGLALRHIRTTPIEISLIPEHVKKQNVMRLKRPFFYASAAALVIYLGISYWALDRQVGEIQQRNQELQHKRAEKESAKKVVESAKNTLTAKEKEFKYARDLVLNRNDFLLLFDELQKGLPPTFWFTAVEFTDTPQTVVSKDNKTAAEPERNPRSRARSGRQTKSVKQKNAGSDVWMNVYGHYCESIEPSSGGNQNSAFGMFFERMKEMTNPMTGQRLFANVDQMSTQNFIRKDVGDSNFNVLNFQFSVQCQKPKEPGK